MDEGHTLIADEAQARGIVNYTPVCPREVVKKHWSLAPRRSSWCTITRAETPSPSRNDVEMTAEVKDAARVLGIGLRDHVIVGAGRGGG